jgi:hypothetical protein
MGVLCRVEHGDTTFTITEENCEKFLDLLDKEAKGGSGDDDVVAYNTISEWFSENGWGAGYRRKQGVSAIELYGEGPPRKDAKDAMRKIAPFVENGSQIVFCFYEFGSYEKWAFEDGKMVIYNGEPDIVWTLQKDQK